MFNATPLLKLYAQRRQALFSDKNLSALQRKQLLTLVSTAAKTKFGRDHQFHSITSVEEYQRRVPLRTYEQFWNDYWKNPFPILDNCTWPGKVPFFAVSSGTSSGVTKYIPFTPEMQRSNKKAGLDLLVHHLSNKPDSRIFAGKSFMLGGSTELIEQAPGVYSGDLSGIAVKTLPCCSGQCIYSDGLMNSSDLRVYPIRGPQSKPAFCRQRLIEFGVAVILGSPHRVRYEDAR